MLNEVVSNIKWLHVLVAALAYFIVGAIWYSPLLFSKKWAEAAGIQLDDSANKADMPMMMITSFVMMFIACVGLDILIQRLPAIDAMGGLKLGILVGICFAVTSIATSYVYQRKPRILTSIDGLYHVIGISLSAMILAGWK